MAWVSGADAREGSHRGFLGGRALERRPAGFSLACAPRFSSSRPVRSRRGPFPAPATSSVACGFPALRAFRFGSIAEAGFHPVLAEPVGTGSPLITLRSVSNQVLASAPLRQR